GVALLALATSWRTRAERTWVIPTNGAVVCVLFTICVWQAVLAREAGQAKEALAGGLGAARRQVETQLDDRITALRKRAAPSAIHEAASNHEWRADAALSEEHYPGFQTIQWVDPSSKVLEDVPYSRMAEPASREIARAPGRRAALAKATETMSAVVARTPSDDPSSFEVLICAPVERN